MSEASLPDDGQMQVIHEEDLFVVVVKRSGFLSVPGRGPEKLDSVAHRIRMAYSGCIEQPAVHRLDMDTSGLLVVARTAEAHRHLSIQFQNRNTAKRYIALLEGVLPELPSEGQIELPFRLDIDNRPYQIYDEVHGKMGVTHWRRLGTEVLAEVGAVTRIEFRPITGRTHQLRVHAAHEKGLGTPIVGDPLYGNGDVPGKLKLHACELSFDHPQTGERLTFHAEPDF